MSDDKVSPIIITDMKNIKGHPKPNEIRFMLLKNGKEVPIGLEVRIQCTKIQNHAHISVKLPDESEFEDMGDLPINNGSIYLPVPFVFLSYAREDSEHVEQINKDLKKHGILTWLDKKNLLPGDHWWNKIEEAIKSSDYVLIFLSRKSIQKSGTFQREIKYALDKMKEKPSSEAYIIPILLENCEPPKELEDIHWSSVCEENWLKKLLKSLRR